MKYFLTLTMVLLSLSGVALADKVVVEEGTAVPITVDDTGHSYTVVDTTTVPTSGSYYYTYGNGNRCYTEEKPGLGVNLLGTFVGVGGGSKIYCYGP